METIYDVVTLGIFAGLIVLFLNRSVDDRRDDDHIWQYLVAAVGCAVTNYLGNNDMDLFAIVVLVATLAFIFYVLKPLRGVWPR